jgi:3-deoxy-D-manno-octulosonic-acid transferase
MKTSLYETFLYIISILIFPFQIALLIIRILKGKESLDRVLERVAIASSDKKDNLIWIHAASVGETMLAFLIVDLIHKESSSLNFLITTGTTNSAKLAEKKIEIYSKFSSTEFISHQFLPIDNIFVVTKFFNYWKPKLGIFVESELWPCLTFTASNFCPLILVNARMSDRSFSRWKKLKFILDNISSKFTEVLAGSKRDFDIFENLRFPKVSNAGNLKYIQYDERVDQSFLNCISSKLQGKKIIFAASTHPGEEELILNTFSKLYSKNKDLFLIIAPRHPERAEDVISLCKKFDLEIARRSLKEKIETSTQVFILDTIGEMPSIFSLKPITIMGGSFTIGGHNILEPARFESPIIFGNDMSNFAEIRDEFLDKKAAIEVKNKDDLLDVLKDFIKMNSSETQKMVDNASDIIKSKKEIEKLYLKTIKKYLD